MNNASQSTENGLYYRHWAGEETKAVVVLVHGLGEHCQRYEHLATHLNQEGFALSSMDLPSHGQSDGIRGHIDSFNEFQNEVIGLVKKTQIAFPGKPLFLLGHSMGGLISTRLLLTQQESFAGALLSAPAIQSPQEPPAWQVAIIKTVARFFPKAPMIALDSSAVSRDPDVVAKYNADPLISKEKLSARFLVGLTDAMEECKQKATAIKLPLLIMHGTADVMTAPEGSQFLHDHVSASDKTLNWYEGLYHEIFNEPEGESIFAEMVVWMNARL